MKNFNKNNYSPFYRPPARLLKARLDNIAIVPASLLPFKVTWQGIANSLPQGSILICHSPTNTKQTRLLNDISLDLKSRGKSVVNMSTEGII